MGNKDAGPMTEPARPKSLLALLDTLAPIDEDFPPITDPLPEPVDFALNGPAHN